MSKMVLKKKGFYIFVAAVVIVLACVYCYHTYLYSNKFIENSEVNGLTFLVPKEIDSEKESSDELAKILEQMDSDTNIETALKDFVVYEDGDTTYSIIKMGQFDLLAFTIDGVADVTEFKTVTDFTDKCYIGEISLTQRGETKTKVVDGVSKQIFDVAIGVIQNTPQYTEDMFTVSEDGEYMLNEDAVNEAIENGTLYYKPEYIETNTGYLSLVSDTEAGKSYGVLVGYSVNDDTYKNECKYISEHLGINTAQN